MESKTENTFIRNADVSDCSQIAEILRNDLGYDCTDELVKNRLSNLDPQREAVFAAVKDGEVVGVVHIEKYITLYFAPLANILGLAVSGKFRRMGIGRSLMQAAEKWALDTGAEAVRLNSGAARTEAHKFYRAIGFPSEKEQIRFMKSLKKGE